MRRNYWLWTGLRQAYRCKLHNLFVEGAATKPPWKVAGVVDEILDLAGNLQFSFSHIDRSANSEANRLAKDGVSNPMLMVNVFPLQCDFLCILLV